MTEEELIAESGVTDDQTKGEANDLPNPDSVQQSEKTKEAQAPIEAPEAESLTKSEQDAYDAGWRPESEYDGKGKWRDAETFLEIHTLNSKVHDLNARDKKRNDDVDRKLEQQNAMHKFQLDALKKDRQEKVNSAVEEGDIDSYKTHQAELDELNRQQAQMTAAPAAPDDPDLNHWVLQNPWLNDKANEQKRFVAEAWLTEIETENPHMSKKQQLNILDHRLGGAYNKTQAPPPQNPNRTAPSTNESGRKAGKSNSKRELTMSDLTHNEKEEWRILGNPIFNGNQKDFLEAVKNSRT